MTVRAEPVNNLSIDAFVRDNLHSAVSRLGIRRLPGAPQRRRRSPPEYLALLTASARTESAQPFPRPQAFTRSVQP
jgi:hypothetical protein